MRNNPLITGLLVVDCFLAFAVFVLAVANQMHARQMRNLGGQIYVDQGYQNRVTALVGEAMEYAKKNSAIDPILQSIGAKPPNAAAPANPKPK